MTEPTARSSTAAAGPPRSRWSAGRWCWSSSEASWRSSAPACSPAAAGLLWADQTQRDDDGYLSTPTDRFDVSSYAIVSEPIDLVEADTEGLDWLLSDDVLGDVRLRASGDDLFIGVGPTRDVAAYLRGVEHHVLRDVDYHPFRARYDERAGDAPAAPPGAGLLGRARVQLGRADADLGSRERQLVCGHERRCLVRDLGGRERGRGGDFLIWLAIGLLVAGGIFLLGGAGLIYLGARHVGEPAAAMLALGAAVGDTRATVPSSPGGGDRKPSRRQPLALAVKWLLAIPHFIVLAFLWLALVLLTVVAAFAILFTERYRAGSSTSTSASCAGPGASGSTRTGRTARIATRRSRSTRRTTRRASRSPTPSG